ncbi:MAG: DUF4168 domain-containing protein [Alcanivorax sp.]|nr:DUF4168 domain-containing protein [Alcanivorax sp.]
MTKRTGWLATLIACTCLSGPALAADAQTAHPQAPTQASRHLPDPSAFSDQDLKQFAQARDTIVQIQKRYAKQLRNSQGHPKQSMQLQQQARQEMVKSIKQSDIDLATYNQIVQLARHDKDFRGRLKSFL